MNLVVFAAKLVTGRLQQGNNQRLLGMGVIHRYRRKVTEEIDRKIARLWEESSKLCVWCIVGDPRECFRNLWSKDWITNDLPARSVSLFCGTTTWSYH